MTRKAPPRAHTQVLSEDNALPLYLREIGKNEPLSSKEEAELAARIRKGDREALERLVVANLRFVVSVSRNYQNQGLPLSDLINEGNLGLIRAARRFDERKNFRFISYAVWWIRQAILQALAEQSRVVRLPLNRVGSIHKIGRAQSKLEQHHKRMPNAREIADELSVNEKEVVRMIQIGNRHASLDAPLLDRSYSNLHDTLHNKEHNTVDNALTEFSLRKEVYKVLDTLPPRERDVVKLYFGIDEDTTYTLDEIGRRYNLTRERVRQIKERALAKLKQASRSRDLRVFYE